MLCTGTDRQEGIIILLASMLEAARAFVVGLSDTLTREGARDLGQLPATVYAPFYSQLDRFVSGFRA